MDREEGFERTRAGVEGMKSEATLCSDATFNHAFSLRRMLETSEGNERDVIYRRKKLTGTSGELARICASADIQAGFL